MSEIKVNITDKGTAKKYSRAVKGAGKATDKYKRAAEKAVLAQNKLKISNEKVALAALRTALAQKKLAQATDRASRSTSAQRVANTGFIRSIGALRNKLLLVTFATAGAIAAVVKLTKVSGDAQETMSKFTAVFKDQAIAAKIFAEELAVSTNRATIELVDFLSTLQDTFVPLGFARDTASELSQKLVTLAVDVASFNNRLDADVIRDFQSALVGNTETVRKYGIVITQATLGQELINAGLADSVKNATEAQKAQARYNIILRSTTDAHGDAARTITSFNNVVVGARSATLELADVMGDKLTPAAGLVTRIYTAMVKELTRLLTPTSELVKAQERLAEITEAIRRIETNSLANLFTFKLPGLKKEREEILAKIEASKQAVEATKREAEAAAELLAKNKELEKQTRKAREAEQALKDAMQARLEIMERTIALAILGSDTIRGAVLQAIRFEAAKATAGLIAGLFTSLPPPIAAVLAAGAGAAVGSIFDQVIPSFAHGGSFTTQGPQLIMVGDNPSGRERVDIQPVGGGNTSNITINILGGLVNEDFVREDLVPLLQRVQA